MMDNAQRLRITHVITDINPGGAELALLRLVEATRDRCAHTIIVISHWDPLRPSFEGLGASVITIGLGRRHPNPIRFARLARALRKSSPDVVQTWLPAGDLLGGLCARLVTRAPVVWNLRNSELDPQRSHRLTRAITRLNGKLSRHVPMRIVAVGERAAEVHRQLGYRRDRIVIIRNGFALPTESTDRRQAREENGMPADGAIVARLGRYHPDKDHRSLMRAWRTVVATHPSARLVLAGQDMTPANAELVGEIEAAGVSDAVDLIGRLSNPHWLYVASDLTVSNSLAEGFPNVVGESMALGTPAIVTDVGDSALLVGDRSLVVPPDDPEALAAAIIEFLERTPPERQKIGAQGRARIADDFSMTTMANRYSQLWQEVADVRH